MSSGYCAPSPPVPAAGRCTRAAPRPSQDPALASSAFLAPHAVSSTRPHPVPPPDPHLPGAPQSAQRTFPGRVSSSSSARRRSPAMAARPPRRPERARPTRAPRRAPAALPAPSPPLSPRAGPDRVAARGRPERSCARGDRGAMHGALGTARPAGGPQRRGQGAASSGEPGLSRSTWGGVAGHPRSGRMDHPTRKPCLLGWS